MSKLDSTESVISDIHEMARAFLSKGMISEAEDLARIAARLIDLLKPAQAEAAMGEQ